MKALIVSDALQETMNIQATLEQMGYDTICYRWLLKALDNLEEIQPHLIIINAVDYPRHWKVMVQHSKCSLKQQPKVVLLTSPEFEEEEAEKADLLGVCGCITGIGQKHMDKLQQLLEERKDCQPVAPSSEAKILFRRSVDTVCTDRPAPIDAGGNRCSLPHWKQTAVCVLFRKCRYVPCTEPHRQSGR